MARKKSPEEQIQELTLSIRRSFFEWKRIKKHGAGDPGWPDGTNMNLVRNHIIHDQEKLRELCKRKCPAEARLKTPRKVSETYRAPSKRKKK